MESNTGRQPHPQVDQCSTENLCVLHTSCLLPIFILWNERQCNRQQVADCSPDGCASGPSSASLRETSAGPPFLLCASQGWMHTCRSRIRSTCRVTGKTPISQHFLRHTGDSPLRMLRKTSNTDTQLSCISSNDRTRKRNEVCRSNRSTAVPTRCQQPTKSMASTVGHILQPPENGNGGKCTVKPCRYLNCRRLPWKHPV